MSGAALTKYIPVCTAAFEEDMASVDYVTIEGMIRTWLDKLTEHNALEEMPVSLEAKSAAKKIIDPANRELLKIIGTVSRAGMTLARRKEPLPAHPEAIARVSGLQVWLKAMCKILVSTYQTKPGADALETNCTTCFENSQYFTDWSCPLGILCSVYQFVVLDMVKFNRTDSLALLVAKPRHRWRLHEYLGTEAMKSLNRQTCELALARVSPRTGRNAQALHSVDLINALFNILNITVGLL